MFKDPQLSGKKTGLIINTCKEGLGIGRHKFGIVPSVFHVLPLMAKDPSNQQLYNQSLVPSSFLLLVVRPGATSSFLLLVAMPFVPSSFLLTQNQAFTSVRR